MFSYHLSMDSRLRGNDGERQGNGSGSSPQAMESRFAFVKRLLRICMVDRTLKLEAFTLGERL
jgi:hypothetical protein